MIPPTAQRYVTAGDWTGDLTDPAGKLTLRINDFGAFGPKGLVAEMALTLHEMVEAFLCNLRGISDTQVDNFDFRWSGCGEPGDSPAAPYHAEHVFATRLERLFVEEAGISWDDYEDLLEGSYERGPTAPEGSYERSESRGPDERSDQPKAGKEPYGRRPSRSPLEEDSTSDRDPHIPHNNPGGSGASVVPPDAAPHTPAIPGDHAGSLHHSGPIGRTEVHPPPGGSTSMALARPEDGRARGERSEPVREAPVQRTLGLRPNGEFSYG